MILEIFLEKKNMRQIEIVLHLFKGKRYNSIHEDDTTFMVPRDYR
jgi:hypothetical protein